MPSPGDTMDLAAAEPAGDDALIVKANEAHRRAMPLPRLIDYGMPYEDAARLHALTEKGISWVEAAEELGHAHLAAARAAVGKGHRQTGRDEFLLACAGFRAAQSAFTEDTPERVTLYRKVIDSFALAAQLMDSQPLKLEISSPAGPLCGWLLMPEQRLRAPVVVIFGGADGWREAYYPVGRYLLDRGLGIFLLDGPGQGESRLVHRVYLDEQYASVFSTAISALLEHEKITQVAVFGNSLGGTLAAGIAAHDARVAAVCVNGGSARPIEVLDRFPRFIRRIAAMAGTDREERAKAVLRALDLGPALATLKCPLLVTHGGADPIFHLANARRIHDEATAADRQLAVWDDGDHCLYNHAVERNGLIANWFADRLC